MNVVDIALNLIDLGPRLRAIDEDYVALIADSFSADGQRTPIEVRAADKVGRYRLIAGAHRVRAAEIAGLTALAAVVCNVSAVQAELLEIDENLMRRELSELDRSYFLARRKDAYERAYPHVKHGTNRYAIRVDKNGASIMRFSEDAAARTGLSERTIWRAVRRHECLADGVRTALGGTAWANNGAALDALARLPPLEQVDVAEALVSGARTVKAARALLAGTPEQIASPQEVQVANLHKAWFRAHAGARKQFLREIGATPAGRGS